MNFGLAGIHSVILMSVRPNAPYRDCLEENGTILICEGLLCGAYPHRQPSAICGDSTGPQKWRTPPQRGLLPIMNADSAGTFAAVESESEQAETEQSDGGGFKHGIAAHRQALPTARPD